MILITGATGQFGNAAIQFLLEKGVKANQIKALVRTEEKKEKLRDLGIEIAIGDYDNLDSLANAFYGIEKLLFISGSDISKRISQHENVISAAKTAGIKHVVYTSFQRKNESESSPLWAVAQSHIHTENLLKSSGLKYSILKNNLYMDFLPGFIGEKVLEIGSIFVPAENGKIATVLRSEMAEAAAEILSNENHRESIYEFTNSEALSYQTIAEVISVNTGKKIHYVSPSVEDYKNTLSQFGLPDEAIGIFSSFATAQAAGELDTTSNDLEKILGRKPTSIREFLKNVYESQ